MSGYGKFTLTFPNQKDWVLGKVLETRAKTHKDREFLQWKTEKAYTFFEVNQIVNRLAHGFQQINLQKGQTLIIMLPNCLEYAYTWFAANKLGAIEVPVNNAYKGYLLEHVANNCKASIGVIHSDFLEKFYESEQQLEYITDLYVLGDTSARERYHFNKIKLHDYNDLYTDNDTNPNVEVKYTDLACILFTSGTTGPSKGVLMPHAQLYFGAEQDVNLVKLTDEDVYMTGNPLFHGNAQYLALYPSLIAGAKFVLYERFSASRWAQQLRESNATVANVLGVMTDFIYRQPESELDNQNRLRVLFAAPTPIGIKDQFMERFGVEEITELYGQTEMLAPVMAPYGVERPAGAAGKLVSEYFDAKIVDPETDEELPVGQMGELLIRPKIPWIINQGYNGMPEKTLEVFRNLWFHSGDALKVDEDGWYYFMDRIKDALRRRGENISSYEVEMPFYEHDSVLECAVVGVPADVEGGEDEVKAFVVLKENEDVTAEVLIRWVETRLPYFAVPRYIEVVKQLPKTPSEKIQKKVLREMGNNETTWDRVKAGVVLKDEAERDKKKNQIQHN